MAKVDVHFHIRSGYATIQENGFEIRQGSENFYLQPVQAYRSTTDIGICDCVIIALKATANDQLRTLISPLVNEDTLVVTLQNGLGNLETLAEIVPARQLVGGLCFVCINRIRPGIIENYFPGQLYLGSFNGADERRIEQLVSLFRSAGVDCKHSKNLETSLWKKLCWNIPFNGLAIAGGGITTDQILNSESLVAIARFLMAEVQAAAKAYGHELSDEFLQKQFDITEPMGAYKPSSLIDYLEGRAVETEAIFGEPLRRGEAKGVAMPTLKTLYGLVQHLAAQRED